MRTLALTLLLLSAAPALAQDGGASSQGGSSETKKKKVIRLDAITVEGRIQKPQAFYILQRSNLSFDDLNRAESFAPKVVKSVDKEPF
jgi:hypothetical protein